VLPAALARRLLYTGEIVDGATAAAMGLVGWCVEPDDLEPTVGGIVARLLRHSPSALAGMKRMYFDGLAVPYREALAAEQRTVVEHLTGNPDAREGLAAFAGKRAPEFQGV
jgi:enoyl-CoA hydratase